MPKADGFLCYYSEKIVKVTSNSEIFRQYDAEDWKRNPGKPLLLLLLLLLVYIKENINVTSSYPIMSNLQRTLYTFSRVR